jgi:hypothetical protein
MTWNEAMLAGAVRGAGSLKSGVQQRYHQFLGNEPALERLAEEEARKEALYKGVQEQRPVSAFVGRMLPSAAIPSPGGLPGAVATGAGLGAMEYGDLKSNLMAGAAGAGAGQVVGSMASRVANAIRQGADSISSKLTDTQQALLQRGQELGLRYSPAEMTGNKQLGQLEAGFERNPFLSGPSAARLESNQGVYNQVALDALGESGYTDLGGPTLNAAKRRIGSVYDQFADLADEIEFDDEFNEAFTTLNQKLTSLPGKKGNAARIFRDLSDEIEAGPMTVSRYKDMRKYLADTANDMWKSGKNTTQAQQISDLEGLLNRQLEKAIPMDAVDAFREANQQYGVLKTLLKPGVVTTAGDLNPKTLANVMGRGTRGQLGFKAGETGNDLQDIARIAQAFKTTVPDSGTPTAMAVQDMSLPQLARYVAQNRAYDFYLNNPFAASSIGGLLSDAPTESVLPSMGGLIGRSLSLGRE